MKRSILTIAAIVAAIAMYDRTAATSSEPAPRTVSGGPTVVYDTFDTSFIVDTPQVWNLVLATNSISLEDAATVIVDAKLFEAQSNGPWLAGIRITHEEVGGDETVMDVSVNNNPQDEARFFTAGSAVQLGFGSHVFRIYALNDPVCCGGIPVEVEGWLRLQIWGCDSPAGCIPGDFNLDGRVDLLDFATFANNFQG